MRDDYFLTMTVLGSTIWLLTLIIVVFFVVFAFYRDRITNPRLAYWAYYLLSLGMIMPSFSLLLGLMGEPGAIGAMLTVIIAPMGLFSGMVLLIWSLLPSPTMSSEDGVQFSSSPTSSSTQEPS